MQERESGNGFSALLKRKREDEDPNRALKKLSPSQLLLKDSSSTTFRSYIASNGDGKAFWLFPNLRFEIDNKKKSFIESPFFLSSNGNKWNILLWPCKTNSTLGVYVKLNVPEGEYTYKKHVYIYLEAYFTIGSTFERKFALNFSETFSYAKRELGYENFINHSEYLSYLHRPFILEATISPDRPYVDSKQSIGYNGIINEGTTCYVNSLLQTLFFIKDFRRAVYLMPTSQSDSDKLPLALQLVFYQLQSSDSPANTQNLLKSFGWESDQWNVQHDVQEFNCVLADALEKKMKNTLAEGTYTRLFMGKMLSFIECIDVKYKSEKIEGFIDLQLCVKGCKNVYESFAKYTEIECLTGEDRYEAEGFGKQDAKKGVLFEELPPVLQIQLKRFEYDADLDRMAKLNHRYEFYEDIDLSKYVKSVGQWKYRLFSILVHRGNATAGHYFVYISPELDGNWYVFNDDSVDRILVKQALENSYGGETLELEVKNGGFVREVLTKNETSAYMLFYIKTDIFPLILQQISLSDIPESIHTIYNEENLKKQEETKAKVLKDSYACLYAVSNEIVFGWDQPGIANPENNMYNRTRFSACNQSRAKLDINKSQKGSDFLEKLKMHTKSPIKLWVFSPGYKNWEFKALDLSQNLYKQVEGKAVFIECEEKLFQVSEGEWKLVEEKTDECSSQGTEVLVDDTGQEFVTLAFKWYEFDAGTPSISVVRVQTITLEMIDLDGIRNMIYYFKYGKYPDFELKMKLYLEKSGEIGNKETLEIIEFESAENLKICKGKSEVASIRVRDGDAFIGELDYTAGIPGYQDAKNYLTELYINIWVECFYYDKYQEYAIKSYSSEIIQNNDNLSNLKIPIKLTASHSQLLHQISTYLSINSSISKDQIQLYHLDSNSISPVPVLYPEDHLLEKHVHQLIITNKVLLFDISPFSIHSMNQKLIIYVSHVDEKFQTLNRYIRLLNKCSTMSDLDKSLKPEMMALLQTTAFSSSEYYLLSHPQNSILKVLDENSILSNICNKAYFYIAFRTISNEESFLAEGKEKAFLYVYYKGNKRGQNEVLYFEKNVVCREVVRVICGRFEEKVKVMACSSPPRIEKLEKVELSFLKNLEETDTLFFGKYPSGHVAVELPGSSSSKNELKINHKNSSIT